MTRAATVERKTNETDIHVAINLAGSGTYNVQTGIGFFNHMLTQTIRHGFLDAEIISSGDIHVDCHHLVEDTGIVLGQAFAKALGSKDGAHRYGSAIVPMEDALALCAVDLSGRPYLFFDCHFTLHKLGDLDTEMIEEFFRAFCLNAGVNLHIKMLAGKNNHHMAEAIFKAFGQAIEQAVTVDPRIVGARSTKGIL
ncbi:MAG: imidazoleglycerol-phosphate dehydratase HisB [Defluviitaleaceae bacterium]|nr:imidazoleglycerol-phosphate dehydratase HisB [Defluviitaleaceae bacterium]